MGWQRGHVAALATTALSGPVAAVSRRPHELDAFVVDDGGRLLAASWNPTDGWQADVAVADVRLARHAAVAAVARHDAQLDVFAVDPGGRLVSAWWNRFDDGRWHTRTDLTPVTTVPGAPLGVVSRRPSQLDLFFVDTAGRVTSTWWDDAGGWRTRADLTTATAPPGAPVAAVARAAEHLDVFVVDGRGRLTSSWWEAATNTWRTRADLTAVTAPPGAHVAAVARTPHQLDVFFADARGRLTSAWWDATTNLWHTRTDLTDLVLVPGSPVAAVAPEADRIDLAFVSTTGTPTSLTWTPGTGWQPPDPLDDERATPGTTVAVVARTTGRLDGFFVGERERLSHVWSAEPEPEPTDRLRLLSFNTKLMYVPVGPDTAVMDRARTVARLLGTLPRPDVVCLQEVFYEPARQHLVDELRDHYPYVTRLAGPTRTLSLTEIEEIVGAAVVQGAFWVPGAVPVAAVVAAVTAAVLDEGFGLPEDSGLLVLSRFPIHDELFVSFGDDATGADRLADKGVLRVRVQVSPGTSYLVLSTHLQASYGEIGTGVPYRERQLALVAELVERSLRDIGRTTDDVLHTVVCGDLNIIGDSAYPQEWTQTFARPGSYWTDRVADGWHRWMGGPDQGVHDEGATNHDPANGRTSRLDYVLVRHEHSREPVVVHQLKLVHPGPSDHVGVLADLNGRSPHHCPAQAQQFGGSGGARFSLPGGRLRWFRVFGGGTWSLPVSPDLQLEVYLPTDLSTPQVPVTTTRTADLDHAHDLLREYGVGGGDAQTYAVPAEEFFVCVRRRPGSPAGEESAITFVRHLGTSPGAPIHLLAQHPPVSPDLAAIRAAWPDAPVPTTYWFAAELFPSAHRVPVDWCFELRSDSDEPVTSTVTRTAAPDSTLTLGRGTHEHVVRSGGQGSALWRVDRADPETHPVAVAFRSPLTFLRSAVHTPRLFCADETGVDWTGADEIELQVQVDDTGAHLPLLPTTAMHTGEVVRMPAAPHGPWRPTELGFVDGLDVMITEREDVLDDDDTVRVEPLEPSETGAERVLVLRPGTGRYELTVTLGRTPH